MKRNLLRDYVVLRLCIVIFSSQKEYLNPSNPSPCLCAGPILGVRGFKLRLRERTAEVLLWASDSQEGISRSSKRFRVKVVEYVGVHSGQGLGCGVEFGVRWFRVPKHERRTLSPRYDCCRVLTMTVEVRKM